MIKSYKGKLLGMIFLKWCPKFLDIYELSFYLINGINCNLLSIKFSLL